LDKPERALDPQIKIAESIHPSFRRCNGVSKNRFGSRRNPAFEDRSRIPSQGRLIADLDVFRKVRPIAQYDLDFLRDSLEKMTGRSPLRLDFLASST
jgi:hypothetical protein